MSESWVGSDNLGVLPKPFSWSSSCTRDFAQNQSWKQVPCAKISVLYAQRKGKGINPVSFRPLLWLAEDFGRPLALSSGLGAISKSVFASLSKRTVGPRVSLWHRVLVKVCQSSGLDYRSLPRRSKQNSLKFKLSKQWGANNRRAPENIYFFKGWPIMKGDRYRDVAFL